MNPIAAVLLSTLCLSSPLQEPAPSTPPSSALADYLAHNSEFATYFEVALDTELVLAESMQNTGSLSLEGSLRVTPWVDATGRIISSYAFDEVRLLSPAGSSQAVADDLQLAARRRAEAELSTSFFAVFAADGRVVETRFPRATSALSQSLAKYLVAALQNSVLIPDDGTWSGELLDSVGLARTTCKLGRDAGLRCVKQSYSSHQPGPGVRIEGGESRVLPDIEVARWQIDRHEDRLPIELEAHEQLRASIPDGLLGSASSQTRLRMKRLGRVPVGRPLLDRWQLQLVEWEASSLDRPSESTRVQEQNQAKARLMSPDMAMSALAELPLPSAMTGGAVEHRRNLARAALAAAASQDEELVAAVAARVALGTAASSEYIGVLTDAGTPQAQKAMLQLLDGGQLDGRLRFELIRQFSHVQRPTEALVRRLLMATGEPELTRQAWFGLGALARQAQTERTSLTRADLIVDAILKAFARTQDRSEGIMLIDALGNAAHARANGLLQDASSSDDHGVRYAALSAIGRYPQLASAELETLLAHAEADRAPRCRLVALRGLLHRALTPDQAGRISAIGGKDPSGDVRKMARRIEAWLAERT